MINLCKDGAKSNQINYMVVPFAYQAGLKAGAFEQLICNLCGVEKGRWTPVSLKENNNELYEHILSLTADDVRPNAGSCPEPGKDNYISQVLAMNKEDDLFPKSKMGCKGLLPKFSYSFENIYLHLFNTGIGFLIFKMNYSELTELEHVILVNNQVKAIKHNELYTVDTKTEFREIDQLRFENQGGDSFLEITDDTENKSKTYLSKNQLDIQEDHIKELKLINLQKRKVLKVVHNIITGEFNSKVFIHELLADFDIITYFNQSFSETLGKQISNKANVFSALNIQCESQENDEINEAFFRLRKGYSKSYIPHETEFSEDNPEVYRPFKDSVWGVSREGCANLTYASNDFMKYGYFGRASNYFSLYIIALHQYYGLLNLAREISYLPDNIDACINKEANERLIKIRNKCNFFYMKSVFDEVSHITHQAEFYSRLLQVLGIRNMQQELNYEIDRISAIVQQVKDKNEEKTKDRQSFWITAVGIVFSLFSAISIFNDALTFWSEIAEMNNDYKGCELLNSIITVGILFLVCSAIIIGLFLYHRNRMKKEEECS